MDSRGYSSMEGHVAALDEAIKKIHWNTATNGLGRNNSENHTATNYLSLPKTFQWLPPPRREDLFQLFVEKENISSYFSKVPKEKKKKSKPKKKEISDADVVWHNAAVRHQSRGCGWEKSRLQWLNDLEEQGGTTSNVEQKPSGTNLFSCCFPFFI